jgi:hypothetical protein
MWLLVLLLKGEYMSVVPESNTCRTTCRISFTKIRNPNGTISCTKQRQINNRFGEELQYPQPCGVNEFDEVKRIYDADDSQLIDLYNLACNRGMEIVNLKREIDRLNTKLSLIKGIL